VVDVRVATATEVAIEQVRHQNEVSVLKLVEQFPNNLKLAPRYGGTAIDDLNAGIARESRRSVIACDLVMDCEGIMSLISGDSHRYQGSSQNCGSDQNSQRATERPACCG